MNTYTILYRDANGIVRQCTQEADSFIVTDTGALVFTEKVDGLTRPVAAYTSGRWVEVERED